MTRSPSPAAKSRWAENSVRYSGRDIVKEARFAPSGTSPISRKSKKISGQDQLDRTAVGRMLHQQCRELLRRLEDVVALVPADASIREEDYERVVRKRSHHPPPPRPLPPESPSCGSVRPARFQAANLPRTRCRP